MGWNLEVACVRLSKGADIGQVVPDVFSASGTVVGFEDATSASRGTDLCAATIGKWAVLIDVACRLSDAEPWLKEASAGGDLFLVRVADNPVALHYREGQAITECRGVGDCAAALGRPPDAAGWIDGEQLACELLKAWTRLNFPNKFWTARFEVFAAD